MRWARPVWVSRWWIAWGGWRWQRRKQSGRSCSPCKNAGQCWTVGSAPASWTEEKNRMEISSFIYAAKKYVQGVTTGYIFCQMAFDWHPFCYWKKSCCYPFVCIKSNNFGLVSTWSRPPERNLNGSYCSGRSHNSGDMFMMWLLMKTAVPFSTRYPASSRNKEVDFHILKPNCIKWHCAILHTPEQKNIVLRTTKK